MRVYVAGPLTQGDTYTNIQNAKCAGQAILRAGHSPMVPHLFPFTDGCDYEDYMRMDFDWLAVADALMLLPGKSPGAEREVAYANALNIPVFTSILELMDHGK